MATKYTQENLSLLNGNRYAYSTRAKEMLIKDGKCVVDNKAYPSLNAALDKVCESAGLPKNRLRAKHMYNVSSNCFSARTLEEDINDIIEFREQHEKEMHSRAGKIDKLVNTEVELAKEIFGIDVPEDVKDKYKQIVDMLFDIVPLF